MRKFTSLLALLGLLSALVASLLVTAAPSADAGKSIAAINHSPPVAAKVCVKDALLSGTTILLKPPGASDEVGEYLTKATYNAPPLVDEQHRLPFIRADS
jgi:hypothetical protein